jgi:hypothetical protein
MVFVTNGTERMRLDSSGRLFVGATSGVGNDQMLVAFNSSGSITQALNLRDNNASGNGNSFFVLRRSDDTYLGALGRSGTDSAMFVDGNAYLALRTGGTERMRITNAGNVGIGTSSPGVRLDVAGGDIRVGNTRAMLFINAAGTATARYTLQSDDNFVVYNASNTPISSFTQGSTNIAVYGSNTNNRMQVDSINNVTSWNVNGSERARINSSGEFLIGTTGGGRTVCVGATDNWIRQANAVRSWLIGPSIGANYLIFDESGGGTRFQIEASTGNWLGTNSISLGGGFNNDNKIEVGQGRTGSNFAYIDLIGDTTYTDFGLRLLRGNTGPNATSELNHRGTGPLSINVQDAGVLSLATSNAERMRIDSSGRVGIGTSGPSSPFQVNALSGSSQVAYFVNDSTGSALGGIASSINAGGNNTSSYHFLGVTQTVAIWYLFGNGTTSYTSDIRVKKNVETTRDGYLDDVCKLRVVKYNWYNDSDDTPRELGFIAQEVEQVFPGLVQDAMHPTKDGVCHKVLKGSVMMPIMLKALQEANAKIDALTARVAQLEGN